MMKDAILLNLNNADKKFDYKKRYFDRTPEPQRHMIQAPIYLITVLALKIIQFLSS
jgi:hypothetical protein